MTHGGREKNVVAAGVYGCSILPIFSGQNGNPGWSRLSWDEDARVFDCGSESPDSSWTMSWHYELMADGCRDGRG